MQRLNNLNQQGNYQSVIYAVLSGVLLSVGAGVLALVMVMTEPLLVFVGLIAVAIGLIALSNLRFAFLWVIVTAALLPYGTLPFSLALTPSLLDTALGIFLVVYLALWMTGNRQDFRVSPLLGVFLLLMMVMLFAFVLGTGNASLTPGVLRRFLALMLNIGLAIIMVDVVRTSQALRQIALTVMVSGSAAAVIGAILWILPDDLAESILNRLGRIGYPVGGVIRYREDGVERGIERAIGTWIDPNAFGGFLMMVGALIAPQVLSKKPVTRYPWLAFGLFGVVGIGLFLTNSRGSMLGLLAGVGLVALIRYRRLIWVMIALVIIAPFLPPTQGLVERFIAGFTGADLETQMRLGEYRDALELIGRYPLLGVGFSAPPDIDLYLGVANTYLTILSNAGIVGLLAYLLTIGSVFGYGYRHRKAILAHEELIDLWLGFAAGVIGALVGGIFDHFYFNIEFQAIAFMFWLYMGLLITATRLAVPDDDRRDSLPPMPVVQRANAATPEPHV